MLIGEELLVVAVKQWMVGLTTKQVLMMGGNPPGIGSMPTFNSF